MRRKIGLIFIAAVLVFGGTGIAEAKQGFYLGLGTTYTTINGDFTGSAGLTRDTDVIILPKINNAFGFDILTGYGINDEWAVELNLMNSGHNGTWPGVQRRCQLHQLQRQRQIQL